jgi:hypothetical protein
MRPDKQKQMMKYLTRSTMAQDSMKDIEEKLVKNYKTKVLKELDSGKKPSEIQSYENYLKAQTEVDINPGKKKLKKAIDRANKIRLNKQKEAVTLGALDVPSMFKKLSPLGRKVVGTTGGLIIPEKIFYELDKVNIMSKGVSEKEAEQQALKNLSLNLVGNNKEYLKKLKETAESMGIDSSTFDSVYKLNVLNKSYQQNSKNVDAQMINALENKDVKTSEELRKNFNKYLERIKPEFERLENDIVGRISGGSPLQMSKARDTVTEEQFQKPFYDLQNVAMEKLKQEKIKAYPIQSRQVDTAAGSIGENFYQTFDSLTQGAKNILQGRIIPFGPDRFKPLESEREKEARYLKDMSGQELYRYNKDFRNLTIDDPITSGDMENLQYENPGVFFAGGGIAKMAGVSSGPPPESGPNPQGLLSLKNRVRNY